MLVIPTARANSFDYKFRFLNKITLWDGDLRYWDVLEADGLMTNRTSQMDVMTIMVGTMADTVLLHTRTIVNGMQNVVLSKKHQGTINGRTVGVNQNIGDILQRKRVVHILQDSLENKDTDGRGTDPMLCQMLFNVCYLAMCMFHIDIMKMD